MKRELLFALKEQEKLGGSVGGTRSAFKAVDNVVSSGGGRSEVVRKGVKKRKIDGGVSSPVGGRGSVKRFTRSLITLLEKEKDEHGALKGGGEEEEAKWEVVDEEKEEEKVVGGSVDTEVKGNVDSCSGGVAGSRKRNGVMSSGAGSVKRFTRSSLTGDSVGELVDDERNSLGVSGNEGVEIGGSGTKFQTWEQCKEWM